jgi:uncharacterized protein
MDMDLHYTTDNQFTSYSISSVTIKNVVYTTNIIVTNTQIFDCSINDIKKINLLDLKLVLDSKPDLIIFGTGNQIIYPDVNLIMQLQKQGIGVEVMQIPALCRTYNFLVSENRKIACILLFDNI